MTDLVIRESDSLPILTKEIELNGEPVNLTGCTVRLVIRDAHSLLLISNNLCVITSASGGEVSYEWPTVPPPGNYLAVFEITYSNGKKFTAPNEGSFPLRVVSAADFEPVVTGADVAEFLGRSDDDDLAATAQVHVGVVTELVRAYTRGRGFVGDVPNVSLRAVIIMATARVSVNPEQNKREAFGDFQVSPGTLYGWTLVELAVLNRYRKRSTSGPVIV